MTLKELREKRKVVMQRKAELAAIVEKREWTNEEREAHAQAKDEAEDLTRQIIGEESREDLAMLKQPAGLRIQPQPVGYHAEGHDAGNGPTFVTSAGRKIRALLPTERMTQPVEDTEESEPVDVGNCLRSMIVGRQDALNDAERRVMSGVTNTGGGMLLPSGLSSQVLDLARSATVCLKAGALTLPMDVSELTLVRQIGDPTAHWRAETVAVTSSDVTFDAVFLRPRTLAAIVPMSIELLEDATNASQIVRNALQQAMAVAIDQAALLGTGTGEARPTGLKFTTSVNSQTGCGTPTNSSAYAKLIAGVGQILTANFPGAVSELALIQNPREIKNFAALVDSTYQPLNEPRMIADLQHLSTTSLPIIENGDAETGGAESTSIIGHFPSMVLGMRNSGVNIRVLESGSVVDSSGTTWNAASQLMKLIVAYIRCDVAILRPSWFTKLTGWTSG